MSGLENYPVNKPRVVLDASAALAFALYDEIHHAQAMALITELKERGAEIHAPSIFAYECDSVIRLKVYAGKLTSEEAQETRELIAALSVAISYDADILERAYRIATESGQPRTYDASYAAFAESRGLNLWTADKRFYNSVKNDLPFVKYVGEFAA